MLMAIPLSSYLSKPMGRLSKQCWLPYSVPKSWNSLFFGGWGTEFIQQTKRDHGVHTGRRRGGRKATVDVYERTVSQQTPKLNVFS